MKKVLTILTVLIITILAAFLVWFLFFRNPNIPVGESVKSILPFGSGEDVNIPALPTSGSSTSLGTDQQQTDEFGMPAANLFRISKEPVAGVVLLKRGTTTIARYVDRATGHMYDTDLATLTKTKVSNQTLPKIYEAYFRPDGNAVLVRLLEDDSDTVENLSLALTPPGTSGATLYTVSSTALRGNIGAVTVGGNTLFYTLRDTSSIVSAAFNGTGTRTLLTSPFSDWRLANIGNNLLVYTKANSRAAGYAYTLSASGGPLTKILGPLDGLAVVASPTGNRVLYSYYENGSTKLFFKNTQNGTTYEILPATLAEKCVWSVRNAGIFFCGTPASGLSSREPDNWYRGLTHFSDYVWRFDTNSEIAQLISEPKKSLGIDIDVAEPKLSPDEDYLTFTNKTDLSLWALRLEQF